MSLNRSVLSDDESFRTIFCNKDHLFLNNKAHSKYFLFGCDEEDEPAICALDEANMIPTKRHLKPRQGHFSVMEFINKMKRQVSPNRRLSQPNLNQFMFHWNMPPRTSLDIQPMAPVHETHHTEKFSRALHTPSRFLPQNQAVITTKVDGTILLFNDIASLCFNMDKSFIGQSILTTVLEDPFRKQIRSILNRRKKQVGQSGHVLVCGTIISIVRVNGTKSIASLWLKEKIADHSERIYLWIFEEIYETSLSVYVDSECIIRRVLGTMLDVYGYKPNDMIGKPVNCLIPALSKEQRDDNLEKIDKFKFFGSQTSQGAMFPVILNLNRHVAMDNDDLASFVIKITSLPSITGFVKVERTTGLVKDVSAVPAKYLFGQSVKSILDQHMHVQDLIPCMSIILSCMGQQQTMTNTQCKHVLRHTADIIYVVHCDKSQFEVELELKALDDDLIDIWITYDRIHAMSKYEKRTQEHSKKRPAIMRSLRISSFGAVEEHKKLFPTLDMFPPSPSSSQADLVPKGHPLDEYEMLNLLGQGTYGMAKSAYRKDDPFKKKLVIKYIIKSRILIDSWIRDRQLGSIPMEIHILRTLQRHPHMNCCRLLTHMEDEDYYFIAMELLGNGKDLFDYIEKNKDMTEKEIKYIFYQVACAVKHLHQHRIVHRDIKDENIILDNQGRVSLIDFGCATYYRRGRKFDTFAGTLEYCAPEILKGQPYDGPPQDIWAAGILLFTLIYRENPFNNIDKIIEGELRVPYILSEESFDLIKKMLERDVDKRFTIEQVLEHPWFHP